MCAVLHLCRTCHLSLESHYFLLEFTQPFALKVTENWTWQANSDRPNQNRLHLRGTPMTQRFTCGYEGNVCGLCFTKKGCVWHSPQELSFVPSVPTGAIRNAQSLHSCRYIIWKCGLLFAFLLFCSTTLSLYKRPVYTFHFSWSSWHLTVKHYSRLIP